MNRLTINDDAAFYIGKLFQNTHHKHHATQLILSKNDINVYIENEEIVCKGIILNKNVYHKINSYENLIVVLFEPIIESKSKYKLLIENYKLINTEIINILYELAIVSDFNKFFSVLLFNTDLVVLDERVSEILCHIKKEESCSHQLEYFSKLLGISKSRISHLFQSEMGVSLKHYILWKKLLFAIDTLRSITDLTNIALDCGFSDLSHLSRTFRKMFGHKISEIFADSISVQVKYLS